MKVFKFFLFFVPFLVFYAMACGGGDSTTQDDVPKQDVQENDVPTGEDVTGESCTPDCTGKHCGDDDGCDGKCTHCVNANETCNETSWKCEACKPDCTGKKCGADDGCGGVCLACDNANEACKKENDVWKCVACTPKCGDTENKYCGDDDSCNGKCKNCKNVNEVCNETTWLCECQGSCEGKFCGDDDGCGVKCKACAGDKEFCDETEWKCKTPTCQNPTAWDPITSIDTMAIASNATDIQNKCTDYDGDGKGNNGFKAVASLANPELQKAIDDGSFAIFFEFMDVTDYGNQSNFTLNGLFGEPGQNAGEFLVDASSYDVPKCKPLIAFDDAKITASKLDSGSSIFLLSIPLMDPPLAFELKDAVVKGTIVAGGADGVQVSDGVLSGVVTKEAIDQALVLAEQACQVPEPPQECSYLGLVKSFLPMLFDLDLDKDGKKDAASVCIFWTGEKGTITGYKD
ncbi:MAG: hypothetical protein FJ088_05960 [Deltaproteobacteria bacterium]|nr:hypothetical protein [Deltaproteobacteria bacterium]